MRSIVISDKELKVNGFPTSSVENLGFEYTFLYYEPEVGNTFKITKVNEDYVRSELLDNEKELCDAFCSSFTPEIVASPQETVQEEDPIIYFVTTEGVLGGCKLRSQLQEGEIEVDKLIARKTSYSSTNHIDFIWDAQKGEFVGLGYENERLKRYYEEVRINDQLDAIWEFIELSGLPLPSKTQAVFDKIKLIKQQIPKQ